VGFLTSSNQYVWTAPMLRNAMMKQRKTKKDENEIEKEVS
jgi:hypothetical protein